MHQTAQRTHIMLQTHQITQRTLQMRQTAQRTHIMLQMHQIAQRTLQMRQTAQIAIDSFGLLI